MEFPPEADAAAAGLLDPATREERERKRRFRVRAAALAELIRDPRRAAVLGAIGALRRALVALVPQQSHWVDTRVEGMAVASRSGRQLGELDLTHCHLGDTGLECVSQWLTQHAEVLRGLRSVSLWRNGAGGRGLAACAAALPSSVQRVDARYNQGQEWAQGVVALAAALRRRGGGTLLVGPLNDQGCEELAAALGTLPAGAPVTIEVHNPARRLTRAGAAVLQQDDLALADVSCIIRAPGIIANGRVAVPPVPDSAAGSVEVIRVLQTLTTSDLAAVARFILDSSAARVVFECRLSPGLLPALLSAALGNPHVISVAASQPALLAALPTVPPPVVAASNLQCLRLTGCGLTATGLRAHGLRSHALAVCLQLPQLRQLAWGVPFCHVEAAITALSQPGALLRELRRQSVGRSLQCVAFDDGDRHTDSVEFHAVVGKRAALLRRPFLTPPIIYEGAAAVRELGAELAAELAWSTPELKRRMAEARALLLLMGRCALDVTPALVVPRGGAVARLPTTCVLDYVLRVPHSMPPHVPGPGWLPSDCSTVRAWSQIGRSWAGRLGSKGPPSYSSSFAPSGNLPPAPLSPYAPSTSWTATGETDPSLASAASLELDEMEVDQEHEELDGDCAASVASMDFRGGIEDGELAVALAVLPDPLHNASGDPRPSSPYAGCWQTKWRQVFLPPWPSEDPDLPTAAGGGATLMAAGCAAARRSVSGCEGSPGPRESLSPASIPRSARPPCSPPTDSERRGRARSGDCESAAKTPRRSVSSGGSCRADSAAGRQMLPPVPSPAEAKEEGAAQPEVSEVGGLLAAEWYQGGEGRLRSEWHRLLRAARRLAERGDRWYARHFAKQVTCTEVAVTVLRCAVTGKLRSLLEFRCTDAYLSSRRLRRCLSGTVKAMLPPHLRSYVSVTVLYTPWPAPPEALQEHHAPAGGPPCSPPP